MISTVQTDKFSRFNKEFHRVSVPHTRHPVGANLLQEKRMPLSPPDIDRRIIPLVTCLNQKGMKTYASCQGHGFPIDKLKPYVAFRADINLAKKLARLVREDAESTPPHLNWGWEVEARFDSHFLLSFHLSPTNPHQRWFRYLRHTLNHDLGKLTLLIKEGFDEGVKHLNRINNVEIC